MLKTALASISKHRDPLMILAGSLIGHATGVVYARQTYLYHAAGSKKYPNTEHALHQAQRTGKDMPTEDHVLPRTTNMVPSLGGSG